MTSKKVSVWYDDEGDMLEVLWAFREGYFTPTDDERVLKRLDDRGEAIGFLIHEFSTLKSSDTIEIDLNSGTLQDDVANLTVKEASARLGVSERRVRQLARDGRIPGATKDRFRVAHPHSLLKSPPENAAPSASPPAPTTRTAEALS